MSVPPGPRWPSLAQAIGYTARPFDVLWHCFRRYGHRFTLHLAGLGEFVFVTSPDDIRAVFTADPDVLLAGAANDILAPLVGRQSVLLLDGAAHHRQRRLLMPPLHAERMQAYATVMREVTERSLDAWPEDRPFRLHPQLQGITLDVILRTVFGMEEGSRSAELGAEIAEMLDIGSSPLRLVPAFYGVDLFRLLPWSRAARLKRSVDRAFYAHIARRRAEPSDPARRDVLSLLLAARDEEGGAMSDEELRDELITLLVAGHETTATALAWAFERLLSAPSAMARLLDELHGVVGDEPVAHAHVGALDYLDAVVKESLRMRPVVALVARKAAVPFALGEHEVPAGSFVMPLISITHMRPDLYPEPDQFRPERFWREKVDPYAWLPFGGGSRRCLGMAFSLYEMKVVLATVLSRARLRAAAPRPVEVVRRNITLAPSDGTTVFATRIRRRGAARPAGATMEA
ncbi:MAG TPA: cytochrome P450 [Myxococcota bacterium]|nr:cytochrome P450 [Myxococcota bacterium]